MPRYAERVRLLPLIALTLAAQTPDLRRTTYPEAYALVELARATPPEFAARGLLQLLDAGAIPTREWQLDISNEVLTLAASARHPLPKRLAPGITAAGNRAMLWSVAYNQGLDTLTLSLRAIDHIRRLDPDAARAAFTQLPRPAPARATCKDALLDDVSLWYTTAAKLNVPSATIRAAIQSAQSNIELAAAIDAIFFRRPSDEDLDMYAGAIAEKLRTLPADDRPFNAALFKTPKKLEFFFNTLKRMDRPTAALADGWRAWMINGLSAPACQETRNAGAQQLARQDAFDLFNASQQPPLDAALLKPTGEGVAADLQPFAENDATREQSRLFKQLLFGGHDRGLSQAEKETPEWRDNLQKYLQAIEGRTRAADESDIEYFFRQSELWVGVIMATPAGPTRDRALQQFLSFLLANAPHIDPAIWFVQLQSVAEITRSLHGGEFNKLLTALHQTGHPVLRLYAALEAAHPTRPQPY